jgi:hypothetical protein
MRHDLHACTGDCGFYFYFYFLEITEVGIWIWWLTTVMSAIQEAEIRRTMV